MKFKKICLSTKLSDLYSKNQYHSHIELNREYWYYFAGESKISDKYGPGWYKLKVTYIRSGCMFYIFPDYPDIEEDFCPIHCFMTSLFELAEFDPTTDLENFGTDINKKIYCFDTERTIIKNWPLEKEIDIESGDSDFLAISVLCKQIEERINYDTRK